MAANILKNHSVGDIEKALAEGLGKLLDRKVKVEIGGLTFEDADDLMFDGHMKASELSISVNRKWDQTKLRD
ncbi:hypothetical protein N5C72_07680 [Achromobacter mucicolens]|uniref:Uncharacterized protein n=1 Tax=Achromobacter mucicolens TaxID=1389922 RepID=A0ABD4YRB1_9BURK|nr:hypothetical protein [Achromobacter mucicolens]MDH1177950.1 hypothetical protein [Achromobacter mucicolens]